MKKFKYEQYDYSFLYGLLTESQMESLQSVLSRFISLPNTEATRLAAQVAVDDWIMKNSIQIKHKLKVEFE